ncbi:TonB-dependent receptor [Ignatzschineria indica]|uniref:TonB-dependent receptor n=1 Tax=Ignatzschineria indica TaxID=472583 RepID=A0A2U2ANS2_9GAMM|nr:TonB-dependent receptor [Ignatzschineria indica]PWD84869.1 hypothetical protein DC082_04925 [Ignatzschineria indica]GGZ79795.1 TonB-dependent receptor [Ignatzschineria indica]
MNTPFLNKGAPALLLISSFLLTPALADKVMAENHDEEIIFTAKRTPALLNEVGTQSIVITEKEIQTRQYNSAVDALAHQPGVILSQNGPTGPSSLYLRGSSNTLLLINGVPVSDPMGTNHNFNYALLGQLLDVNRIEVLKGPQSALYGSSAMGGVVQIFTNDLNNPGTRFRIMAGSHETIQVGATTTGSVGDLRYSLSGLFYNTRGIDVTTDTPNKPQNDYDKDRNKNRQLSGRFNYILNDNLDVDLDFTYNNRYDEFDNLYNVTPYNDYNKSKIFTGRVGLNGSFFEDQWSSTFSYGVVNLDRDSYSGEDVNRYDPNPNWKPTDPDWMKTIPVKIGEKISHSRFRGKTQTLNFDNELTFYQDFSTRFGVAYHHDKGSDNSRLDHSQNTKSIYVEQSLDFADKFFNTVGIRYDKNSIFGSKTTYRLTSRYNVNEMLAVKGSFGTGFTTPTIYQLYVPIYGDRDLKPETSRGYDLGVELRPSSNSLVSLNYFYTDYKNMIVGNSKNNYKYENLNRAKIKGVEIAGSIALTNQLAISASYTYLNAKQRSEGGEYEQMIRRPKHQITANVTYQPIQNLTLNASAIYYSQREDAVFGKPNVKLDAFTLFDIAGSYKINNTFEVDAKIQNLFNKDYEFARGYREKGRTAYLGVNISL